MIWHDGAVSGGSTVVLDASDRGLLLADGLFETLPAFNGRPFRQAEHWDRLIDGAGRLGFAVARERLDEASVALLQSGEDAVLRVTVTRGPGPRGLMPPAEARPTILATTAPWLPHAVFSVVALATATIRRNRFSPLANIKSLQYLDNVLALRDARRRGADDALMLNDAGSIACTTAANVFAIVGTRLITPPLQDAVLPGIMRRWLLREAPSLGLTPHEASLASGDLHDADAVLLTNSVRLLSVVDRLDGAELRSRSSAFPGRMAARIASSIEQETGLCLGERVGLNVIDAFRVVEN